MDVTQFILNFVISLVGGGAVSWLVKSLISERLKAAIKDEYDIKFQSYKSKLDAEPETHKADLKSRSDVELERLKSSLTVMASEQNAKFSRLHNQRFDVISELYAKLKRLHLALADYVSVFEMAGDPSKAEKRQAVVDSHKCFVPYFMEKQVFLPKEIVLSIEALNSDIKRIYTMFLFSVEQNLTPDPMVWGDLNDKVEIGMKRAFSDLEDELRKALGDNID